MGRRVTGRICVICLRSFWGKAKVVRIDSEDGSVRGGYMACTRPRNLEHQDGDTCADVLAAEHPDRQVVDQQERPKHAPVQGPRRPPEPPPPVPRRRMRTARERRGDGE